MVFSKELVAERFTENSFQLLGRSAEDDVPRRIDAFRHRAELMSFFIDESFTDHHNRMLLKRVQFAQPVLELLSATRLAVR